MRRLQTAGEQHLFVPVREMYDLCAVLFSCNDGTQTQIKAAIHCVEISSSKVLHLKVLYLSESAKCSSLLE